MHKTKYKNSNKDNFSDGLSLDEEENEDEDEESEATTSSTITGGTTYYFEDKFNIQFPIIVLEKNNTTNAIEDVTVNDIGTLKTKLFPPTNTSISPASIKFPITLKVDESSESINRRIKHFTTNAYKMLHKKQRWLSNPYFYFLFISLKNSRTCSIEILVLFSFAISVTRCQNKKLPNLVQKLSRNNHSRFYSKKAIFQRSSKRRTILGLHLK